MFVFISSVCVLVAAERARYCYVRAKAGMRGDGGGGEKMKEEKKEKKTALSLLDLPQDERLQSS